MPWGNCRSVRLKILYSVIFLNKRQTQETGRMNSL